METALVIIFLIGLGIGGVGGFFIGSGRTVEVNNAQYTEVVTTTVQNQAQVTIVGEQGIQKIQYVLTNFSSRKEMEAWLLTLDPFQLSHCEVFSEKEWIGTRYTVIYPVYVEGMVTNTSRTVLTNTGNTNQLRVK
ncbi:hypothetical protein BREVNS_0932 [Brevinematales bacterium NS]|nr:hypothetical protein [Brevinematales bacterium]QJR21682.1 hypothetical protein BREVNS_0932 [Brevinematales bacterium NS]